MKLKKCIDCSSYFPVTVLKKKYLFIGCKTDSLKLQVTFCKWYTAKSYEYSFLSWSSCLVDWTIKLIFFLKRLTLTHYHGIYWTPVRNLPGIRQSEHKLHIHTSLVSITPLWQSVACFYTTVIILNEEKQLKCSL